MKVFSKISMIMAAVLLLQLLYVPVHALAETSSADGGGSAGNTVFNSLPVTKAGPTWTPDLTYVAIGDSLAFGVGPFDKPGEPGYLPGKSYTDFIAEALANLGSLGHFNKWHSYPGYTTSDVLERIRGNVTDSVYGTKAQDAIGDADLITISAGANDALRAVKVDYATGLVEIDFTALQEALHHAGQNMAETVTAIHALNPDASVYIMGYYNPFPHLGDELQPQFYQLLSALNHSLEMAAGEAGAIFVPTRDAIALAYDVYLPNGADIHLSEPGYVAVASEFWNSLEAHYSWIPEGSLKAGAVGARSVELNWTPARSIEDGVTYSVYNGTTRVGSVTGDVYSYLASSLQPRTNYTFSVMAMDGAGQSSYHAPTLNVMTASLPQGSSVGGPLNAAYAIKETDESVELTDGALEVTTEEEEEGLSTVNVSIRQEALEQAVEKLKNKKGTPRLLISVKETGDSAVLHLAPEQFALIQREVPAAILELAFRDVVFHQPADVIAFDEASSLLGEPRNSLRVLLEVHYASGEHKYPMERVARSIGMTLFSDPVYFAVSIQGSGSKELVLDNYGNRYVERSFTLSPAAGSSQLTAVRYDWEKNEFIFVPASFASSGGSLKATVKSSVNSPIFIGRYAKSFSDTASHWAKGDIELLASKLLIQGMTDSAYAPENAVTRAEFATLLVRALGAEHAGAEAGKFRDVPAADWFADAVLAAAGSGLVEGFENGTFRPNDTITREQMAAMLVRAMNYIGIAGEEGNPSASLSRFQDAGRIQGWAREAVAQAVNAGIVNGMPDGTFRPADTATRAQAAVMLKRFLEQAGFIE